MTTLMNSLNGEAAQKLAFEEELVLVDNGMTFHHSHNQQTDSVISKPKENLVVLKEKLTERDVQVDEYLDDLSASFKMADTALNSRNQRVTPVPSNLKGEA